MSDLISRSALIEFVKEELKQDRPYDFKIKNIQRFIEDIPTAYDISKVVAELESKRDYRELTNYYGDVIGVRNIDTIKIDKAINIVRKGGAE